MKEIKIWLGHLAADAVVNNSENNRSAINFFVIVNERKKNKAGEYEDITTKHECVYWRNTDSLEIAKRLIKGAAVSLRGDYQLKTYLKDKNNPASLVPIIKIKVDKIQIYGTSGQKTENSPAKDDFYDEDLPF